MSVSTASAPPSRLLWAIIKASPFALKLLAGLVLFGLWEVCTWAFAAPFVTRPSGVIAKLPAAVMSTELWAASWSTLSAVLLGLAVSLVAGLLIGVAMGRQPWVNRMAEIWVNSFYAMPMVAVLPVLTMWFGYSSGARFAIIVFAALFSIILNVADGVRNVPREYLEVARSFRAGPRDIWFGISLFASLPYLIAGIRLAIGRGLVGAVLAEIYASVSGIGFYILSNARALEQDVAMCAVLILAAFGIGLDAIMGWMLRRWFPWYRREGRE
ncbi:MAG: ABC transporter permease [Hyphomicrobiales bacterium]|nr:ABC transporter permease [Hyphomicrobiales bacterium]